MLQRPRLTKYGGVLLEKPPILQPTGSEPEESRKGWCLAYEVDALIVAMGYCRVNEARSAGHERADYGSALSAFDKVVAISASKAHPLLALRVHSQSTSVHEFNLQLDERLPSPSRRSWA